MEEPLNDVIFSLLYPGALRSEWRNILGVIGDVRRACHFHVDVVCGCLRNLQHVSPDVIDRFKLDGILFALGVAFFHIKAGWQPKPGLHVGAPGVEVVVLADVLFRASE